MKNVYLFQPQYAVDFDSVTNYWLPYSAACIWSYASQFDWVNDHFNLAGLFFKREPIDQVIKHIVDNSIIGFSCFQWNRRYSLHLAELIKQKFPNCIIVFGGPEVNSKMLSYPFIDCIVTSEGELSFLELLEDVVDHNTVKTHYNSPRIEDLSFPSPYQSGLFDSIIADNPGCEFAATLETNRGCPYACTFCDWGSLTYNKVKKFSLSDRVMQDIDWMAKNPISYVFCADANFGIFKKRDLEIARYLKKHLSGSAVINFQFAKNHNMDVFEILGELNEEHRGFTVSVQSLNSDTLDAIKRKNMKINNLEEVFRLCSKNGVASYTEFILGLPLETKHSFKKGLCDIINLGQHNNIEVWFTALLENAELNQAQEKEKYGIKTVVVEDFFAIYNHNDTKEFSELVEIVNETSTMSTQDMIDSYMFAWLIINLHINGWTQIYSRYLNGKRNLSYLDFYINLENYILNSNNKLSELYSRKRTQVSNLLHGKQLKNIKVHNLLYEGVELFWQNNQEITNNCASFVQEYNLPKFITDFQNGFIVHENNVYPLEIQTDYNFFQNTEETTKYILNSKIKDFTEFYAKFYGLRRRGLTKAYMQIVNS